VDGGFTFYHVPSRNFPSLENQNALNFLMQWSMKGRLHCQCYSFDETFKTYDFQKFATAFFNSDVVRGTLETDEGLPSEECEVEAIHVPCSLLSMDIFNRCVGVVTHPTGRIKSCFEEYHNSVLINDCLKRVLVQFV
uniref:Cilia- and flagella-associated protein 300 n=2 Tax=Mesocestoides corti TaxID=53468 RepID=A0A5K3EZL6_MESCO